MRERKGETTTQSGRGGKHREKNRVASLYVCPPILTAWNNSPFQLWFETIWPPEVAVGKVGFARPLLVGQRITARHKFGRSGRILVSEVVRESAYKLVDLWLIEVSSCHACKFNRLQMRPFWKEVFKNLFSFLVNRFNRKRQKVVDFDTALWPNYVTYNEPKGHCGKTVHSFHLAPWNLKSSDLLGYSGHIDIYDKKWQSNHCSCNTTEPPPSGRYLYHLLTYLTKWWSGILTPTRWASGLNSGLRSDVRSKHNVTGPGNSAFKRSSDTEKVKSMS